MKELILKLAREKKIELDLDEVAQTNYAVMAMASSVLPSTPFHEKESSIQFRTFEPIVVWFQ